jgi:hypothetical protein
MKEEIMKSLIILLLTAFILSCATAPPPQISDDGFISSRPSFQVQFHKPIAKKFEESERYGQWDEKSYTFWVNNREGVVIQISKYIQSRGGIEFYGAEQVLTSMGRVALDSVVIDGRQWIKFVDVTKNKYLLTGYFRFVDNSFISVFRVCREGAYAEEIEFIKSGTSVNYQQKKLLNEEFASTAQLFSIGAVTQAKLESESLLSAKEIKTAPEKTKTEAERSALKEEKPKVASISKDVSDARVSLRKEPTKISNEVEIKNMLEEYGFFEMSKNFFGDFENDFVDNNDGTVTDNATGLMWQKSGSLNSLDNRGAKEYIKQLNRKRFAGHADWRMPTVEELASLIKKAKTKGVHLYPVFDNKQISCWTVDPCESNNALLIGAWIVSFKHGEVDQAIWGNKSMGGPTIELASAYIKPMNYVKAVRSDIGQKAKEPDQPKDVSDARVSLRKEPTKISNEMELKNMLVEHGFFDMSKNFFGAFENDFVDNNDGTITDKATGLMWQKSGSISSLDNLGAKEYIKQLNKERFAGHSDWRMPTVEELASLIKKDRRNGVHIAPVFDNKQIRCWTADPRDSSERIWNLAYWIADFKDGTLLEATWPKPGKPLGSTAVSRNHINYLKAVRSFLILPQN